MIHHGRLEAFVAFAERMSFTRAAEALQISQPALHVQIRKLSEELGVPLYVRKGRSLELTAEGERLLAYGREVAERSRLFLRELHGEETATPITLASGEGSFRYLLGEAIRDQVRAAEAPLLLLTRDAEGTAAELRRGRAHLGVTVLGVDTEGLQAEALVRVGMKLVLPAKHALTKKKGVTLADLDGERLVVPPRGRAFRAVLESALAEANVRWEVGVEASGWDLMLHFARLGLGLAIVSALCPEPRGMAALPLEELPRATYSLVEREGTPTRPAVESLKKRIRAAARRLEPAVEPA